VDLGTVTGPERLRITDQGMSSTVDQSQRNGSSYSPANCGVDPNQIRYLRVVIHFGVGILVIPASADTQSADLHAEH
jgi:hypothetical protein